MTRTAKKTREKNTKDTHRTQLGTLSRVLRDVHRSLVEFTRERYELENGRVRGKGQMLELLLRDEAFAWLRPLSRLIVEIDQLAGRRTVLAADEVAAVRVRVENFISPGERDAFGSRYTRLLASEPKVAMNHGVLREAISDLSDETAA